jgi:hypothetical protein
MSTSHPILTMFPPRDGEKVPGVTLKYFTARNRRRAFNFLVGEFKKSGITRSELAFRTGKSRALISRLLGQPSNLTADTAAELLFAICGGEIQYSVAHPLSRRLAISRDENLQNRQFSDSDHYSEPMPNSAPSSPQPHEPAAIDEPNETQSIALPNPVVGIQAAPLPTGRVDDIVEAKILPSPFLSFTNGSDSYWAQRFPAVHSGNVDVMTSLSVHRSTHVVLSNVGNDTTRLVKDSPLLAPPAASRLSGQRLAAAI